MINEAGTMSGGGGKPRGGRMCLGNAAPRPANDTKADAAELASAEADLSARQQARAPHFPVVSWRPLPRWRLPTPSQRVAE